MPLKSKRTVRVHDIPAGTTKEQYLAFVEHLCTKPPKPSRSPLSWAAKHFKEKFKSIASASIQTDEVGEDARSTDESDSGPSPSGLRGEAQQAAPLLDTFQPTVKGWLETTFCLQNDHFVGTISFGDESLKQEVLARQKKKVKWLRKSWFVVDSFDRITILYEGPNADFDICAVHGQDGNAMDTWTADSGQMWLRDFLPEYKGFENSRIMTFGYDSDLTDRKTVMELDDWAETLLESLDKVRTKDKEKKRPLLLVCHSLGGLVVRKAMIRLPDTANYENIELSQFGIVFLATPHGGSTVADWNKLLVATAHIIGGIRTEAVRYLQPSNPASVRDEAAFLNLQPRPPFRCFSETRTMRVGGRSQLIVTQESATLGNEQASPVMNVDHVSISKFESIYGPFSQISGALLELLRDVTTNGVQQPNAPALRMFGQPRFQAHAYPPDEGCWWEGKELKVIQHQNPSTRPFFGRTKELETLKSRLATESTDGTDRKLTIIKGIAGIGKTELLLHFALMQKGHRNVFFLRLYEDETLDSVVSKLSMSIGFEMIENPAENQERWRNTPISERIDIFIDWLRKECNKKSLFIVDDIEAFGYSRIPTIMEYQANHTLVSTRDSNLEWTGRDLQELRLSSLERDGTVHILQRTLRSLSGDSSSWDNLDTIAHTIQDHPLAARNAIPFTIRVLLPNKSPSAAFSESFESQDPEERKVFLKYSFEGQSLWGAFDTSLKRLALRDNPESAASLLQILPFLSCDDDNLDDFLKMDKRLLLLDHEKELPDMAIFKSSYTEILSSLLQLRSVSFFLQSDSSDHTKALNIHPLMMQYLLLRLDTRRRTNLIRQVLQLCHILVDTQIAIKAQIQPHVLHCVQVCRGLGMAGSSNQQRELGRLQILSQSKLELPESTIVWMQGLQETEMDGGRRSIR